ncbi:MAG: dihydrofolate reductase [Candidatus Woesearchaeota archaeon]
MKRSLIVAQTADGLIGKDNDLPWPRIKEDMKLFQDFRQGKTLIMGRNTWDSIPEKYRPFKNSENIIVSRSIEGRPEGTYLARTLDQAEAIARVLEKDCVYMGGRSIYKHALTQADEMHISWIKGNFEGNVFFPKIDWNNWKEISTTPYDAFDYVVYERATPRLETNVQ